MTTWKVVHLADVADEVTVGFVGPMRSEYRNEGVPFLRSQNVKSHRIDPDGMMRVSAEFHRTIAKSSLRPGDVVTVRTGAPGTSAVIPDWLPDANCADLVITRPGPELDPRWLSYYLNSAAQGYISSRLVGAVQQHFNVGEAKSMKLPLPTLPEQQAIAEVLEALDDKIAVNARIAEASDALVRATFASLGSSAKTRLGDLCESVRDQVAPSPGQAYVGLEHVPRRHMWLGEWGESDDVTSAKARFERGDVLFGKLRPYFHKVVSAPMSGIASTDILVLRAKDPELTGFVLAAAASDAVVGACSAASAGTKMPRTNWSDLAACEVPWPSDAEARRLSRTVIGLRDLVEALIRESHTLAELRDTLLPALMDGTIRVKDVVAAAEEVL